MGMLMRRHRNRYITNRAGEVAESGQVRPRTERDGTDATAVPVNSLGRHLGRMKDADAIRDAMARDERKSARALYEARLRELEPDQPTEGDGGEDTPPVQDAPSQGDEAESETGGQEDAPDEDEEG